MQLPGGEREKRLLEAYVKELLEWNQSANLIGRQTTDEVWENHIRDSLELLPFVCGENARTVADIGSGGGLPGIPLSVCIPGKTFYLCDVVGKKLAFLQFCAKKLGIDARAVDINQGFRLEVPCVVVSRAFAPLSDILDWADKHLGAPTAFHLLKGQIENAKQEIADAGVTGAEITPLAKGCVVSLKM
jgi:16S rRNA (guanine527-N7)-methyltransferase